MDFSKMMGDSPKRLSQVLNRFIWNQRSLVQKKSEEKTRNRKENTYWIGSSSCVAAGGIQGRLRNLMYPFLYTCMPWLGLDTHLCEGEGKLTYILVLYCMIATVSSRNRCMGSSHEIVEDYVEKWMLAHHFSHYYNRRCRRMVLELTGVISP